MASHESSIEIREIKGGMAPFESPEVRRQYYLLSPLQRSFFARWLGNDDPKIPGLTKWSRRGFIIFFFGLLLVYAGFRACEFDLNTSEKSTNIGVYQIAGYVSLVIGICISTIFAVVGVAGIWAYQRFEKQERAYYIRIARLERQVQQSTFNDNPVQRRVEKPLKSYDLNYERHQYYVTSGVLNFISKWYTDDDERVPKWTVGSRPAVIGSFFGLLFVFFGIYMMDPDEIIYPNSLDDDMTYWAGFGFLISGSFISVACFFTLLLGIRSYYVYQTLERCHYLDQIKQEVREILGVEAPKRNVKNYGSINNAVVPKQLAKTETKPAEEIPRLNRFERMKNARNYITTVFRPCGAKPEQEEEGYEYDEYDLHFARVLDYEILNFDRPVDISNSLRDFNIATPNQMEEEEIVYPSTSTGNRGIQHEINQTIAHQTVAQVHHQPISSH